MSERADRRGERVGTRTVESAEAQLMRSPEGHARTHAFFLAAGLLLEGDRVTIIGDPAGIRRIASKFPCK